ncbi:hypothetical protein CIHG_00889 [Coccidioides immitis H538.4]|uniref:Uncharacterized protein n=2 Tax=Coccidioides immitis TaxID=5501 RepID=A0A0J8RDU4_COCIT|nr:hypothetical protein CIRG_03306 [Coccidioides immitis RMSCC 2394]KMU83107.1 hypothetical protein CIHG_00889 [Coccidioides immitis H538.4]
MWRTRVASHVVYIRETRGGVVHSLENPATTQALWAWQACVFNLAVTAQTWSFSANGRYLGAYYFPTRIVIAIPLLGRYVVSLYEGSKRSGTKMKAKTWDGVWCCERRRQGKRRPRARLKALLGRFSDHTQERRGWRARPNMVRLCQLVPALASQHYHRGN